MRQRGTIERLKSFGRRWGVWGILLSLYVSVSVFAEERNNGPFVITQDDTNMGSVSYGTASAIFGNYILNGGVGFIDTPVSSAGDHKHRAGLQEIIFTPNPPLDFLATSPSSTTVDLSWTHAKTGLTFQQDTQFYQVAYSSQGVVTDRNFDASLPYMGEIVKMPRQGRAKPVELNYDTHYYFAVKSLDGADLKNRSYAAFATTCTLGPQPTEFIPVFSSEDTRVQRFRMRMNLNNPLAHTLHYDFEVTNVTDPDGRPDFSASKVSGEFDSEATHLYELTVSLIGIWDLKSSYFFRVRVQNQVGAWSDFYYSDPIEFNTSIPQLLAIAPTDVFISSVTVRWDLGRTDASTKFYVETSTDPSFSQSSEGPYFFGDTEVFHYTVPSLPANKTHYFRLKAFAATNEYIGDSNRVSTTTLVPRSMSLFATVVYYSSATLNWRDPEPPDYPSRYVVQISTRSDWDECCVKPLPTLSHPYTIPLGTLMPNTTHYARVVALNSANVPSPEGPSVPTSFTTKPVPPTDVHFSPVAGGDATHRLKVEWTDLKNNPLTEYEAVVSTDPSLANGFPIRVPAGTKLCEFYPPAFPILANTKYFVGVKALAASRNVLEDSDFTKGVSTFTAVLQPQNLTIEKKGPDKLTLVWADFTSMAKNPETTGYQVSWSSGGPVYIDSKIDRDPDSPGWITFTAGNTMPLSPNAVYHLSVKALSNDESSWGDRSTETTAVTLAWPPVISSFKPEINLATVTWSPGDNPLSTRFNAVLYNGANGFVKESGVVRYDVAGSPLSFTFTDLTPNTQYVVKIQSFNSSDDPSVAVESSTFTKPISPTIVSMTQGSSPSDSLILSWTDPLNPPASVDYRAELSTSPLFSAGAKTKESGLLSANFHEFSELVPNTTYYGRVWAISKQTGWQALSGTLSGSTEGQATVPEVSIYISSVTVSWRPGSNPDGTKYTVTLSTDAVFDGNDSAVSTTEWSASFLNLDANSYYSYKVKTHGLGGDQESVPQDFYTHPDAPSFVRPSSVPKGTATHRVALAWEAGLNYEDGTTYEVGISSNDADWTPMPSTVEKRMELTRDDFDLWANAPYFLRVRTLPKDPDQSPTEWVKVSTYTAPLPVQTLTATPGFSEDSSGRWIDLHWENFNADAINSEETRYKMVYNEQFSDPIVEDLPPNASNITLNPLLPNTVYEFSLITESRSEINGGWPSVAVPTSTFTKISDPGLLGDVMQEGAQFDRIRAEWYSSNNKKTVFCVSISTEVSFDVETTTTARTVGLDYLFENLISNKFYHIKVQAEGVLEGLSGLSYGPFVTLPSSPVITNIEKPDSRSVLVEWDPNGNDVATLYDTQINDREWEPAFNVSSKTHSGLQPNTEYYFNARAQPITPSVIAEDCPPAVGEAVRTFTRADVAEKPESAGPEGPGITKLKLLPGENPPHTFYAIGLEKKVKDPLTLQETLQETFFEFSTVSPGYIVANQQKRDVWKTLADWTKDTGIVTAAELPDSDANVFLYSRNQDGFVEGRSRPYKVTLESGEPVVTFVTHEGEISVADSLQQPFYTNLSTLPFQAKGSTHYNFKLSHSAENDIDTDGPFLFEDTIGWSGTTDNTKDYKCSNDGRLNRYSKEDLKGFCIENEGVWFFHIVGNAFSGGDFSDRFFSTHSFRVFVDTTPADPGLIEAYVNSGKEVRIDEQSVVSHLTPYFEWRGANDLGNTESASPVLGYSWSLSTDPTVDPIRNTNSDHFLDFNPEGEQFFTPDLAEKIDVSVSTTVYFRVVAYDKAGNWSPVSRSFAYRYAPDDYPPELVGFTVSGKEYPEENGKNRYGAVDPDSPIEIAFSERMFIDSAAITLAKKEYNNEPGNTNYTLLPPIPIDFVERATGGGYTYTLRIRNEGKLLTGATYVLLSSDQLRDTSGKPLSERIDITFHTALNGLVDTDVCSEDEKIRIHVPAGSLGSEKSGVVINDTPHLFGLGPVSGLAGAVTRATSALNRKTGGRFRQVFTTKELNVFKTDGTLRSSVFQGPVTLSFPYEWLDKNKDGVIDVEVAGVAGLRVKDLAVCQLDDRTGVWDKMPESQFNEIDQEVFVTLRHFSTYALVAAPNFDLAEAHPYPVPYRVDKDPAGITFKGLSNSPGTIKIYTLDGRLVKKFNFDGDARVSWNPVVSESGDPLGSDVYLYVIENAQEKRVGKLMVIR